MGEKSNRDKLFGKYQEIALLTLGFFLTTIVGGILGYYFQKRSWEHQHKAMLIETELKAANEVFQELSRLMDVRLYRMRKIIWGCKARKKDSEMEKRWDMYRQVLYDWNDNLNRNLALTQRYFGSKMRYDLERIINEKFRALGSMLESNCYKINSEKINAEKLEKFADNLNNDTYTFNIRMIQLIQKREVGIFNPDIE